MGAEVPNWIIILPHATILRRVPFLQLAISSGGTSLSWKLSERSFHPSNLELGVLGQLCVSLDICRALSQPRASSSSLGRIKIVSSWKNQRDGYTVLLPPRSVFERKVFTLSISVALKKPKISSLFTSYLTVPAWVHVSACSLLSIRRSEATRPLEHERHTDMDDSLKTGGFNRFSAATSPFFVITKFSKRQTSTIAYVMITTY